tara:strand:- start:3742 stop:4296 length:555 start_codon:yes stop_codon:yes gene_type:complete
MADIQLIIGCMFSGKSTELIRRINKYKSVNKNVVLLNSSLDSRTGNSISTHDNEVHEAVKVDSLVSFFVNCSTFDEIDVIGIDEAQFFKDLYTFLIMIEKLNIKVIVAGLDGDYERKRFGQILDCIPISNSVTKLTALCQHNTSTSSKCAKKALFSKRVINDVSQVCIGASDKYIPVCREHYLN